MVAVQKLLMRGRLRGEQRGDRQVMPFDTIDPYDTPGRRLSLSLLQQHLVICISFFLIKYYNRQLYHSIFSTSNLQDRNVLAENLGYKNMI